MLKPTNVPNKDLSRFGLRAKLMLVRICLGLQHDTRRTASAGVAIRAWSETRADLGPSADKALQERDVIPNKQVSLAHTVCKPSLAQPRAQAGVAFFKFNQGHGQQSP